MIESLRIAVADDEGDMRDWFERMIPLMGHQVVAIAENGRELVEFCRATQPDLVITDVKMPVMDGIEAAQAICRERPVAIILVTAYHDPELIRRAEADDVQAYLVKPVGQADLAPAIALAARRFADVQRREAADLRQSLADRKIIEQAKGVLMSVVGVDEREAFQRLQEMASEKNQKLVEVAHLVLAMQKALRPPPR